jgi:hypothetical protein
VPADFTTDRSEEVSAALNATVANIRRPVYCITMYRRNPYAEHPRWVKRQSPRDALG